MAERPEVCVGAIALDGDRVLLVRRGQRPEAGRWSIPGGRVEVGETLAEAVVRELAEETALTGVCDELVGWVERVGPGHHYVILDFRVTILSSTPPAADDDAEEVAWFPLTDVPDLPLVEGLADFFYDRGILPRVLPGSA
jgi:ADP-ribose pyrophosphatase YjhB (NUDIX family)